jgi:hypothetical protein
MLTYTEIWKDLERYRSLIDALGSSSSSAVNMGRKIGESKIPQSSPRPRQVDIYRIEAPGEVA